MMDGVVHQSDIVVLVEGPEKWNVVILTELSRCLDPQLGVLLCQPHDEATVGDQSCPQLSGAPEQTKEAWSGGSISSQTLHDGGLGENRIYLLEEAYITNPTC